MLIKTKFITKNNLRTRTAVDISISKKMKLLQLVM